MPDKELRLLYLIALDPRLLGRFDDLAPNGRVPLAYCPRFASQYLDANRFDVNRL
tara:strand:- start:138 stop:302 length:165 start_codon:yes stop_codon:yes gene_type:complete